MKKILAIDDSEINLQLLKQVVKIYYHDFLFLKATSGEEGIEIAKNEKPEVILLDILMPGLDGYQVCNILKHDKTTRHIPILMVSALGQNSSERTKGLDAGADAFISKPFNQVELRAQINVVLRVKEVEDLLRKRNEELELFIKGQTNKFLESEERFLQISEHAMEFYWEVNSNDYFTYVSPVIEKTLGVTPSEIVLEKNLLELFQLNDAKSKNSDKIQFINHTSFKNLEVELKINTKKIWLSISGFTIFGKNRDYNGKRGVCYDITKRKQAEIALGKNVKQIKNYQKKLKKLNIELTSVEERERRRIAENLHDSLGQTLSLAFLKLSSIIDENFSMNAKKTIAETSGLLDKAISESRSLTYDLSPPILYELGLVPAIKWKLEQIEKKHQINTVLIGEGQRIDIQKEFNIFIYRIVSELVTNVIKHANAKLIEIEIRKEKEMYYIIVRDDGVGFEMKINNKRKANEGFGLMSITERLDSIKGKFKIQSKIGKGTEAKIIIPVGKN
ncbi:MAG: response regulator [Draconibacterium sp.]|nr:response regulator [Draconibacterium sp.]